MPTLIASCAQAPLVPAAARPATSAAPVIPFANISRSFCDGLIRGPAAVRGSSCGCNPRRHCCSWEARFYDPLVAFHLRGCPWDWGDRMGRRVRLHLVHVPRGIERSGDEERHAACESAPAYRAAAVLTKEL